MAIGPSTNWSHGHWSPSCPHCNPRCPHGCPLIPHAPYRGPYTLWYERPSVRWQIDTRPRNTC